LKIGNPRRFLGLAFSGCYGEKGVGFLLDVTTAAVRAGDVLFVVLVQGEGFLEFLVAIVAEIIVHGHGNLPRNSDGFYEGTIVLLREHGM
jgi:hypothetical protein